MSGAAPSLLVLPLAATAINAGMAGVAWQRSGVPGTREFACLRSALAGVVRQALDASCGGAGEPEERREPSRSPAGP